MTRKKSDTQQARRELKAQTFAAYGGKCKCCGEDEMEFLGLHHTNGDGAAHRTALGVIGGITFYQALERLDYPKDLGLEVWCANCHQSLTSYGRCAHLEARIRQGMEAECL